MRTLTDHIVSGDQAVQLSICTADDPAADGANHAYLISWEDGGFNGHAAHRSEVHIGFQKGPIREVGVNGLTHEALLAIVIDRLRSYQSGPYACQDNADALADTEAALKKLQKRTLARIARGVEGTHAK